MESDGKAVARRSSGGGRRAARRNARGRLKLFRLILHSVPLLHTALKPYGAPNSIAPPIPAGLLNALLCFSFGCRDKTKWCWDKLEVKPHPWLNQHGPRKPTYASKSRAKLHAASMRAVSSPLVVHRSVSIPTHSQHLLGIVPAAGRPLRLKENSSQHKLTWATYVFPLPPPNFNVEHVVRPCEKKKPIANYSLEAGGATG